MTDREVARLEFKLRDEQARSERLLALTLTLTKKLEAIRALADAQGAGGYVMNHALYKTLNREEKP